MQLNREEILKVINREVNAFLVNNREAANDNTAVLYAIRRICDEAYERGDLPVPLDVCCEYDPEDHETYFNLYVRPDPPMITVEYG